MLHHSGEVFKLDTFLHSEAFPVSYAFSALGGVAIIMISFTIIVVLCRKKGIKNPFYLLSRNSPEPFPEPDIEDGSVYFGVPLFSYAELEEVTNNFDASKELGNGGFGTVYYGKKLILISNQFILQEFELFCSKLEIMGGLIVLVAMAPFLVSLIFVSTSQANFVMEEK